MFEFLILNIAIFIFSLLVILDLKVIKTPVQDLFEYWNSFQGLKKIIVLGLLGALGVFLYRTSASLLQFLIVFNFSLAAFNHLIWVSLQKRTIWQILLFTTLLLAITSFIGSLVAGLDHEWLRNIFYMVSISWFASLVRSFPQFKVKHFYVLSGIWMLYDILYVSTARIFASTEYYAPILAEKLAIVVGGGEATLGLADLLWLAIFYRFLEGASLRLNAAYSFVFANLILVFALLRLGQWVVIPLLVLWIPIGFLFLEIERRSLSRPAKE